MYYLQCLLWNQYLFQKEKKKEKKKKKHEKNETHKKKEYLEAEGITTPSLEQLPNIPLPTPANYKLPVCNVFASFYLLLTILIS